MQIKDKKVVGDEDTVAFNLTIKRKLRASFKKTARAVHDISMHDILSAFIISYVENPHNYYIKTILGVKNNDGE